MKWSRVRGADNRWEYVSGPYRIAKADDSSGHWMLYQDDRWLSAHGTIGLAKGRVNWLTGYREEAAR